MTRKIILFIFSFIASQLCTYAQSGAQNDLVKKLSDHQKKTLQEKIFLHLDRTFYVGGETMWMKIYVLDGYEHRSLDLSKVVYVDVLDRNKQPVIQTKISIEDGRGNGSVIIPASLDSDHYTVRAYTNWMKNFSADFYFHQTISIVNVFQRLDEKNSALDSKLDIQFFPEGGNLVEGVKSKVAFRVVNSSGKGIPFTGIILNTKGDTVTTFSPLKFGIGHFTITPKLEETYQVRIKENSGNVTLVKLPPIQTSGYTMRVTDTLENKIKIHIKKGDNNNIDYKIYLIGHTRQIVNAAFTQNLIQGETTFLLNKKELGEGIVHLTVFDESKQPVCERLYFNRPTSTIPLGINSDKTVYEIRSKITLSASIKNNTKAFADVSLSVFKNDSLQQIKPIDIQSYLWLTSELKGSIESPEYYFNNNPSVDIALDNLLLTHGWSRFSWTEVLESSAKDFHFIPEYRGHIITGKVIEAGTSKPNQRVPVYLSTPDKRIHPYMTYSGADGQVLFETNDLVGNKKLIIQTANSQSTSNIEIESPFSESISTIRIPYLKLSENLKASLTLRSISMQTEDIFYRGRVKSKPETLDSSAFYGNAPEQYNLDDYTRFPVMEEVIREYVKGVRLRKKDDQFTFKTLNAPENYLFENGPFILLDGVPVFNMNKIMAMDPLKIKSLDVVTNHYYYGQFTFDGIVSFRTYKNDLGGLQLDPDAVVIDYEGLQSKKEFFSPRYETSADKLNRKPDLRNLLIWIPDLKIGSKRKDIEFFSSDEAGIYQAIIQGISENGRPVFQTHFIEVKSQQ